jgi:hypothetical protein
MSAPAVPGRRNFVGGEWVDAVGGGTMDGRLLEELVPPVETITIGDARPSDT